MWERGGMSMNPVGIAERLEEVRERVASAARASGREVGDVRLIAVSKSKPVEAILEAYDAGQRDFGENYVQEFASKVEVLAELSEIRWHMIGHVQTNKAKDVARIANVVQTVDSVRLAEVLGKRAEALGKRLQVLVEVNVGGEESKTGAADAEAREVVKVVRGQGSLALRGLMTVPPYELEASQARSYFQRLRALRDELGGVSELPELSMGMSHDFEEAISCGATMVRVGTAIFGERA